MLLSESGAVLSQLRQVGQQVGCWGPREGMASLQLSGTWQGPPALAAA
jgi:hypothetical protein